MGAQPFQPDLLTQHPHAFRHRPLAHARVGQLPALATTSQQWTRRIGLWAKQGILPILDCGQGTAYPIFIENLVDLLVVCLAHPDAVDTVFNGVDDGPVTLGTFLGAYMKMVPTRRALYLPGRPLGLLAQLLDPFSRSLKLSYVVAQMRGRGQIQNYAAHNLGWEPRVSLSEGLALAEAWLRNEGVI